MQWLPLSTSKIGKDFPKIRHPAEQCWLKSLKNSVIPPSHHSPEGNVRDFCRAWGIPMGKITQVIFLEHIRAHLYHIDYSLCELPVVFSTFVSVPTLLPHFLFLPPPTQACLLIQEPSSVHLRPCVLFPTSGSCADVHNYIPPMMQVSARITLILSISPCLVCFYHIKTT